ncbi:hypothetical protein TNCV_3304141 [Trichonephila clavipes]|nr:hypothetical protein TNCV_3304141 [Trichonephila clavipes]
MVSKSGIFIYKRLHLGLNSRCYVRPVVEYGNEVLITASDSVKNRLNLFQNSMLHLITGGAKLTPIASMELQTDLEPLSERSQSRVP